jgi:DNA-binding transcriptional ArsR family regulator
MSICLRTHILHYQPPDTPPLRFEDQLAAGQCPSSAPGPRSAARIRKRRRPAISSSSSCITRPGRLPVDRWKIERALLRSSLRGPSRLIALTLLSRANAKTGVVPPKFSPSLSLLATDTGLDRSTVRRHLNVLESAGWVTRIRDPRARQEHIATRYRLHVPGLIAEESTLVELGAESPQARGTVPQGLGAESPQARGTVPPNQTVSDLGQTSLSPRARIIAERLPDATPDEREMIISRIEDLGPNNFAAYVRAIPDTDLAAMLGDIRDGGQGAADAGPRPQDLYPDPHSEACRGGQHARCGYDWCTCSCHPKRQETA